MHRSSSRGRSCVFRRLAAWAVLGIATVSATLVFAAECETPPPAERNIRVMGYYRDAASSVIDPALKVENKAATRPFRRFVEGLATMSDAYIGRHDEGAARCALSWLDAWAEGGAMLGQMIRVNNDQSEYVRQWTLGAAGIAYLKTRRAATPDQRKVIQAWLKQLARATLVYWESPKHKRNNHYYWTGLGVLAAALATHDQGLLDSARSIYQQGIDDIQADGSLPMEMARKRRALHYHDYAIAPLVMMAELARLEGQDWYAYRPQALERLAERVATGYQDPFWFNQQAGVRQEPVRPSGSSGWVEFYRLRSPHPERFETLHEQGPFRDPWMGGDLTLMAREGITGAH
ncbi:polysaccharide lyase [Bordetella avium]|uniref:polysaccharide lyase n=1 Tax=Bordetella avium TaxID=521 RepID=UPI000E0B9E21|nr:polysaccharide lyase [Bordetella avium]RIQ11433.1 polysaccharide lyase [Bordetella avium]RIQ34813.1 polysaccharide lyase [Bordetella avium]RIQ38224.1 polysaccharide lyase [Bordetella avium]RIQ39242.1 polysaccharide lyase [Bordetella avium]RIQ44880.1 polysaccharide lyase [Bordetella avium]